VDQFIESNGLYDLKVVFLVRDPRGNYASRKDLKWKTNFRRFCNALDTDVRDFSKLKSKYPFRYTILRYEDLALDTKGVAKKLLSRLDLPYSTSLSNFLDTHTVINEEKTTRKPYTLVRDTHDNAFRWLRTSTAQDIKYVQNNCAKVIKRLGYKLVPSNWTSGQDPGQLLLPLPSNLRDKQPKN